MRRLIRNVRLKLVNVLFPYRERTVSPLPLEELPRPQNVRHKVGRRAFYLFGQRRYSHGGMQADQEMHVIICAPDGQRHTLKLAALLGNGCIKAGTDFLGDQRQPIPGGPHQMQIELGVRRTHQTKPNG